MLANNQRYDFENKNDAYDKALFLLKDRNTIGHTISIIEWLMAHNLLIRKVNINNYNISQINKMSQNEINNLAKLLNMKGNKKENIVNILKFLHKLDEENTTLLPEINDIILQKLYELDISNIDFHTLKFDDDNKSIYCRPIVIKH